MVDDDYIFTPYTYNNVLKNIEKTKKEIKSKYGNAIPSVELGSRLRTLRRQKKYYGKDKFNVSSKVTKSFNVYLSKNEYIIPTFKSHLSRSFPNVISVDFPYIQLNGGFNMLMNKEWFFLFKSKHISPQIHSFNKKVVYYVSRAEVVEDLGWCFVMSCSLLKYHYNKYGWYGQSNLCITKNGSCVSVNKRSKKRAVDSLEIAVLKM